MGEHAKGLSANTVSRQKSQWYDEHQNWQRWDLSQKCYVYWWADGIYSQVRMDDRLCLLVIIGVTEHGHKELVRTTNPIESACYGQKNVVIAADTTLAMVFKLMESAQKRWIKIRGFNLLTLVVNNVKFKDGEQVVEELDRFAAEYSLNYIYNVNNAMTLPKISGRYYGNCFT